ncbi:hypothetical protein ACG33_02300 [Steroidobacter denitrificans]|uniref:Uncharacterized protein n=1 Tax=Steroidobacter denitrificans TaxID=465721 RepID=A0A127F8J5_STEDE|nr:hypothetical protein ACG33_02300 [Steroidobacter denitrificans]
MRQESACLHAGIDRRPPRCGSASKSCDRRRSYMMPCRPAIKSMEIGPMLCVPAVAHGAPGLLPA